MPLGEDSKDPKHLFPDTKCSLTFARQLLDISLLIVPDYVLDFFCNIFLKFIKLGMSLLVVSVISFYTLICSRQCCSDSSKIL